MNSRQSFRMFIRDQLGQPYRWSGDAPGGWDCSGLVLAGLRHVGYKLPDMTSAQLAAKFTDKAIKDVTDEGQLVFYHLGIKRGVTHVMVVYRFWDEGQFILAGARGGDRDTTTVDIAWKKKAFVDLVHGDYCKTRRVLIVDPFKDGAP